MSSYDSIDEALNTTSIEVSTTPENGCVKRKDQLKNVSQSVVKSGDIRSRISADFLMKCCIITTI